MFVDSMQVELHRKYDLRQRPNVGRQESQPQIKKGPTSQLKDMTNATLVVAKRVINFEPKKVDIEQKEVEKLLLLSK